MTLDRYLRTPKGQLLLLFLPLLAVAGRTAGYGRVAPLVLGAVGGAAVVDLPALWWKRKRWVFPDGAILTGLIVAMVLSPHERWYVGAITAAVGVAAKYLVRSRQTNALNPAALALVLSYYLFQAGHSWWGALAEVHPAWLILLFAVGAYITDRVARTPAALTFLLVYYALFTATAFVGDPARMAELYRAPDVHAALYFALFMVTDPPTSPARPRDQVVFGVITGVAAWLAFVAIGAVWWLPGGLLVANAWEAVRRALKAPRAAARSGTPSAGHSPAGAARSSPSDAA